MFEVGLSTCGKGFSRELFESFAAVGIKNAELSYSKAVCDDFDFAAAKKYAAESGVALWSFHLPFMPFYEIDISEPLLASKTVSYLAELIKKGAAIGIEKFVIHPSGEPILPAFRKKRMEIAKESLNKLALTAKENGAVLCVEDLPRTCLGRDSADILELLTASPDLRVCFDTNHLLTEAIPSFINAVGDKIVTLHVSDYDFTDEKHWLPGEGKIDWNTLIGALVGADYRGVWLYELGYKTPKSIKRPRDLTPADFAENARKLFSEYERNKRG